MHQKYHYLQQPVAFTAYTILKKCHHHLSTRISIIQCHSTAASLRCNFSTLWLSYHHHCYHLVYSFHQLVKGNISFYTDAASACSPSNLASKDQSKLSEPIKELDILLTQIAAGVPLDIMPGPNDPANFSLPQQPLHRCLFPGSSAYNTFRSCPNPHSFELDNVRFLGTSGQNIDDLEKYSEAKDKLEFMERTLRWRHISPTAPNTLGCYPFTDRDPFFIESCPHVYFIGNQDKYATRLIKGSEGQVVRLICIPRFGETGIAVVLNMGNLECHALSFGTEFSS